MTHEFSHVDISGVPTLWEVVEQVRRTRRPAILHLESGESVAMVVPFTPSTGDMAPASTRAAKRARAEVLRFYQAVPALPTPVTDRDLTELAEHKAGAEFVCHDH